MNNNLIIPHDTAALLAAQRKRTRTVIIIAIIAVVLSVATAVTTLIYAANKDNAVRTSAVNAETTYILNKSTKKFHRPNCDSVAEIKEQNKKVFTGTRQDAINSGYTPCQRCVP